MDPFHTYCFIIYLIGAILIFVSSFMSPSKWTPSTTWLLLMIEFLYIVGAIEQHYFGDHPWLIIKYRRDKNFQRFYSCACLILYPIIWWLATYVMLSIIMDQSGKGCLKGLNFLTISSNLIFMGLMSIRTYANQVQTPADLAYTVLNYEFYITALMICVTSMMACCKRKEGKMSENLSKHPCRFFMIALFEIFAIILHLNPQTNLTVLTSLFVQTVIFIYIIRIAANLEPVRPALPVYRAAPKPAVAKAEPIVSPQTSPLNAQRVQVQPVQTFQQPQFYYAQYQQPQQFGYQQPQQQQPGLYAP